MKTQIKTLVLSLSLFLSFNLLSACGPQGPALHMTHDLGAPSIVGGQVVDKEAFAKNVIALYNLKAGVLCTATLIAKNLALTAAHCANVDLPSDYAVYFTKSTRNNRNLIARQVVDLRVFDYNPQGFFDRKDLAIVRFSGDLPAGYEPMALPTAKDVKEIGKKFFVAGFGTVTARRDLGDRQSGTLRYTRLKIVEGKMTAGLSQFTAEQDDGHGICHGDSGGPAFVTIDNRRVLIGVSSAVYTTDKNAKAKPKFDLCLQKSIFISTFFYLNWIREASAILSR